MAGNRQVFEQAMRQGANYAWDKQWEKAVAEYQNAIAEFPEEAPAYTALGQALVHAGRAKEALQIYQRAARLTPSDPSALMRVAEVQEQLGDVREAVRTWLHTADLHLRHRDVTSAVRVWQHVIEIAPNTPTAYERLAKAYVSMDRARNAVRQYLTVAAIYQERGANEQAMAACQSALELDPRNSDVSAAMEALEQGDSLSELLQEKPSATSLDASEAREEPKGQEDSPVAMTRQKALTELADTLLEDSGEIGMEVVALLLQAVDLQSRGEGQPAITNYEKALSSGADYVAARFNLGLLYQESSRLDQAVSQLQQAAQDPGYALGANFALGECLQALGKVDKALTHFIEALKLVDLSTVGPERSKELNRAYDDFGHSYPAGLNSEAKVQFIDSLTSFLSGEKWEDRLFETRQQLNRLSDDGIVPMAEILILPGSESILFSMVKSQEYFEQGLFRSASEECLWAIEHAPSYLPLHLYLAKLFMQGNQIESAINKYLFIANTYAVRDEMNQALELYERVLSMAPMNLDVRQKLILLLEENGLFEQAMEHRLAMANSYYELAQIEASREQYTKALDLTSKLADKKKWTARILHRLADIDMQRLDWRSAIEVYSQLKDKVPGDEKARQQLVDLYFNLQRLDKAVAELDELVSLYRQQGNLARVLELIEELVERHSEELELRKRAAQLCVETGNRESAIPHLDAMGELQLQAGRTQEAVATIKAIVALGPENVEAYRQLLEQISEV